MKTAAPLTASINRRAALSSVSAADLHVFLAYQDLASALRAAETLAALSRKDADGVQVHLSPWSFAALENSLWRAEAVNDFEQAHLIVIAAWGVVPLLPAKIERWLRTCLAHSAETHRGVAAFFGCDNRPDRADSPRLRSMQRLAHEAGCAFFAPGVTEEISVLV